MNPDERPIHHEGVAELHEQLATLRKRLGELLSSPELDQVLSAANNLFSRLGTAGGDHVRYVRDELADMAKGD